MVVNTPTADDFYISGKELLNFAWDTTANLLVEYDQSEYYGVDKDEISDSYWSAAKRRLTTSLSVAQQGIEFILKGKIAEISPYLLITEPPSRWPSPYQKKPVDFSDFRTVDAQDLIRIYDTFSNSNLDVKFRDKFHELREKRNSIMHSISKNINVHVIEVIESILYMHKVLFPQESWAMVRRQFLESAPDIELGSIDYVINRTCWEMSLVVALLEPAKVKEFLGIDKKHRLYICPKCLDNANTDAGFDYKLAMLRPNRSAKATKVFCLVCNDEHEVERGKCGCNCGGTVISLESGICLSCCDGH